MHFYIFPHLLLIFACQNKLVLTYMTTPTLQPLQYIDLRLISEFIFDQARDTFVGYTFPQSVPDAAASIISSGASGLIAGVTVSIVAGFDGNKNFNDSALASAGTSGFYFATRSSVSVIGEIIGMSTPVVDILAIILPIMVSELFKLRVRAIKEQQTRVGEGPTMLQLMRFERPSMKELMQFRERERERTLRYLEESRSMQKPMLAKVTSDELISDITRYVTFAAVYPAVCDVPVLGSAEAGATAGLIAQLILEKQQSSVSVEARTLPNRILRCLRATCEGSFQFLAYECSKKYLFGF